MRNPSMALHALSSLGVVFLLLAPPAGAQCKLWTLTPWEPYLPGGFGYALATGDDRIFVGAPFDGENDGAVHVFDATDGSDDLRMYPPTSSAHSFGYALDATDRHLVVGAPLDNAVTKDAGAVYVYDLPSLAAPKQILPKPAAGRSYFGQSVSIEGQMALVGAPRDGLSSVGAAWLVDLVAAQKVREIKPPGLEYKDKFGEAVSLDGGLGAVGAPGDDDVGLDTGAVYVVDVLTGAVAAKLTLNGVDDGEGLGAYCSIDAASNVVAASGEKKAMAVIWDLSTGAVVYRYVSPTGAGVRAVVVEGDRLYVALSYVGPHGGAVAVIDWTQGQVEYWMEPKKEGWKLGRALSLDENRIVVASPSGKGAAYVYELPGSLGASYCGPANLNSTGMPAAIAATGSVHRKCHALRIEARNMPANQMAMPLASLSSGFVPDVGGTQGNLCLGSPIIRFLSHATTTSATGQAGFDLDWKLDPWPGGNPVKGETWHFQVWFRDMNPGPTSNFTDGASVMFL